MSKKNTTTSINATTNTNEKKEGITMSKKNTTATTSTTTSPMTAQEFKQASYDAYLSYVAFIEGKQDSRGQAGQRHHRRSPVPPDDQVWVHPDR